MEWTYFCLIHLKVRRFQVMVTILQTEEVCLTIPAIDDLLFYICLGIDINTIGLSI